MVIMIHPKCITSKFLLQMGLIAGATLAGLTVLACVVWLFLQLAFSILLTISAYCDHADFITKLLFMAVLGIGIYWLGSNGVKWVRSVFKQSAQAGRRTYGY
ncbi:hypothetical protein [Ktedonospora formicarum]|uniref:Uncharacterized protein n=1 Tax=Ktedonospora formicarum TaxID=2778364 RepID=A0A8J3IE46_9CHLR|nr:hypothetical protein [Ktedonospora formicarum]GHO51510.1 hypothetical protein KSX_96730 [Ktedonospora formicarum]